MKKDLKAELVKQKANLKLAREKLSETAAEIFQLYANLLSEEARQPWDKIVTERTESDTWIDIYGEERNGKEGKTYKNFLDCVSFHLQTQFQSDAAEVQARYIESGLKKPVRVPVRQFFQRVERLNSYLLLLPCTFYRPNRNDATEEVKPFSDHKLAEILLRMCPRQWQDQYRLNNKGPPQSIRKLLSVLKTTEDNFLAPPASVP